MESADVEWDAHYASCQRSRGNPYQTKYRETRGLDTQTCHKKDPKGIVDLEQYSQTKYVCKKEYSCMCR